MDTKKSRTTADDLMTVQEAADLRDVSRQRIHQWIGEGRLTRQEKYGRVLVSRAEVLTIEAKPGGRPRKEE